MIPIGQRVAVLASSTKKSGAHIRRGSIGYVSRTGRSVTIDSLKAVVTMARIVFVRFGFEKRSRNETKTVFLIYPLIPITVITNAQAYLNNLTKGALNSIEEIKNKLDEYEKDVYVVAAAQAPVNILTNKNEYRGWFLSALQSGKFYDMVTGYGNKNEEVMLKQVEDKTPGVKELLKSALLNKNFAINLSDAIYKEGYYSNIYTSITKIMKAKISLHVMSLCNDVRVILDIPEGNYIHKYNKIAWFLKSNNLSSNNNLTPSDAVINGIVSRKTDNTSLWIAEFDRLCKKIR